VIRRVRWSAAAGHCLDELLVFERYGR
jgi:hypothetical protein